MHEQVAREIIVGGMLTLLLSVASGAAAEPASEAGPRIPAQTSSLDFATVPRSDPLAAGGDPWGPGLEGASPDTRRTSILRYERPLHLSDTDMLLRIRPLKNQRKLLVVEVHF